MPARKWDAIELDRLGDASEATFSASAGEWEVKNLNKQKSKLNASELISLIRGLYFEKPAADAQRDPVEESHSRSHGGVASIGRRLKVSTKKKSFFKRNKVKQNKSYESTRGDDTLQLRYEKENHPNEAESIELSYEFLKDQTPNDEPYASVLPRNVDIMQPLSQQPPFPTPPPYPAYAYPGYPPMARPHPPPPGYYGYGPPPGYYGYPRPRHPLHPPPHLYPYGMPPPQTQLPHILPLSRSQQLKARSDAKSGDSQSLGNRSEAARSLARSIVSRASARSRRREQLRQFLDKQHHLAAEVMAKQATGEIAAVAGKKLRPSSLVNNILAASKIPNASGARKSNSRRNNNNDGCSESSFCTGFCCLPKCLCLEWKYCVFIC